MQSLDPSEIVCTLCLKSGRLACKNCVLVVYCSAECQRADWHKHKPFCRSPLLKASWHPQWILERRLPAWVRGGIPQAFGGGKYFFGNVPAIDILQMQKNEGAAYAKDISLLLAGWLAPHEYVVEHDADKLDIASGDLRNIVKTVASIPQSYTGSTTTVMNDHDLDIVARNIILLLIALTVSDQDEAVDCMIHVWYSAMITDKHEELLYRQISPIIKDVVDKIKSKQLHVICGKTWKFGTSSLRVELKKEQWENLQTYLTPPANVSASRANQCRQTVTLASERQDYRDRQLAESRPAHRVVAVRFREDGIFLPFGLPRDKFTIPNPTFYQSETWPMKDSANPLNGWDHKEIHAYDAGPAKNDLHGKGHHYIRHHLKLFRGQLVSKQHTFRLLCMTAMELPQSLGEAKFDRIEVSNVSDGYYMGIANVILNLGPLLQSSSNNPHATLITLFMNAVPEMSHYDLDRARSMDEMTRAAQFMRMCDPSTAYYDAQNTMLLDTINLLRDNDYYFQKYMDKLDFKSIAEYGEMRIKNRNSVVEKWPLRLKLKPQQAGALEEFLLLRSSAHTGNERYVEWTRTR